MFTKLRPKQEQFLWLVVEGVPQRTAYAQVYGQHLNANTCAASSSKLLTQPNVLARRQELIASKVARQPITADFLTRELMAVAGESRALGQGSAAVAAMMGAAKLQGLIVDKVQQDVLVRKPTNDPQSPDEMSAEQWLGLVSGGLPTTDKMLTIEHNQHNLNEHEAEPSQSEGSDST